MWLKHYIKLNNRLKCVGIMGCIKIYTISFIFLLNQQLLMFLPIHIYFLLVHQFWEPISPISPIFIEQLNIFIVD